MAEKKYVVWKRNDGYIDVSTGMPNDYVTGGNPPLTPGGPRPGGGIPVTYVQLGEFTDWWKCYDFVMEKRREAGFVSLSGLIPYLGAS